LKIHIVAPQVFFHNDIKKKCEKHKLLLIFNHDAFITGGSVRFLHIQFQKEEEEDCCQEVFPGTGYSRLLPASNALPGSLARYTRLMPVSNELPGKFPGIRGRNAVRKNC
jgi:hypothetical protein